MSLRSYIKWTAANGALLSVAAMVLFAGIAAACSGWGGGGGGGGGCAAPSVSTGSATSITSNSATLNGSVNPQGCYTEYAFEYGKSSEGYPNEIGSSAGSGTSPVSVQTYSGLGLQPTTSYHFRLTAWNSGGEITGGSGSFTTKAACSKPTVTTGAASSITPYQATMNGTVSPGGCETMYKFEWGPGSSPSTYPYLESGYVGGTSPVSVSKLAKTLEPGQSYHFRISATNSGGAATPGVDKTFTATPLTDYVALGDSYSSGTGTRTFVEPTCRQSVYSYPWLLHNAHPEWVFKNRTCHGAETYQLIHSQAEALTVNTKWVTYTIGGNDSGFSDALEICAYPETTNCMSVLAGAESFINTTLKIRLDEVNNKIKEKAPYAKVVVLDYPRIFNGEDCNYATFFAEAEMKRMNEISSLLKTRLSEAASRAGFLFGDVIPIFNTHAVCDGGEGSATEWINGFSSPLEESYHPKVAGHANGYYPIVRGITG